MMAISSCQLPRKLEYLALDLLRTISVKKEYLLCGFKINMEGLAA
jgi:hypothetical protein